MAQKMIILWSPQSMDLIADLQDYLTEHLGENKANDYIQELFDYTEEKLVSNPERTSPCINAVLRKAGCRCLLFKKKYVIVFDVMKNNQVHILGVVHFRRSPSVFEKLLK